MKPLPDNPNLDQLRRQAKELLAGLRDTSPHAALSDAQAELARQYGFRSWTDLKAEVDRRAGQADIADPGLAAGLAERYDLGRVTGPMRSLARPDESGRRWYLETDRGRWEARTMDDWFPIVDIETGAGLQEAAILAGIELPRPVRSTSGGILESVGEHTWRVDEWVQVGPPLSAPVSAAVAFGAGEILATLHGLALPVDRVCPWHSVRLSDETWPDLAIRAKVVGAPWADQLAESVPNLVDLESIGERVRPPAPVLSHNSFTPGVVRKRSDGRLIVFGWDHPGGQPPSWELAAALTRWVRGNPTGARSLLDGYRSIAGELPRLDLPMFRGAVISLSNYVNGEITTALTATTPTARDHANRSVHHVLSTLPHRTTLERLSQTVPS